MKKKTIGLLIILAIIIVLIISSSFILFSKKETKIPIFHKTTLGSTDYGSVKILEPYGNSSSAVKIAFIVGVHPLENKTHKTLVNILSNEENLKYSYYIYQINVTKDIGDYSTGRMNGQLLAQNFVVIDALDKNFCLVIDVHSNEGNWDENQFLFAPDSSGKSEELGEKITSNCSFLAYYVPPSATSPEFVTIPLINNGVPAVIYEEYYLNSQDMMNQHIKSLIQTVDSLKF